MRKMIFRTTAVAVVLTLGAVPLATSATPLSRRAELILDTASPVRNSSQALQLVRRNAAGIAPHVRRYLGLIGHIFIALPCPKGNWKDSQLPPAQVQFLFQHARADQWQPNSKWILPSKIVAVIGVPMVKAKSSYRLVDGRVVVRTLVQTSELSEMRDANGRLIRHRETVRRQPVYATDLRLLVDETGRIFI